jgi:uncharacterized protein (DUF433 family)
MSNTAQIEWSECDAVERVPGKMGGRPVIKGTRIEPDTIVVYEEHGYTPEQTHADYPTISVDTITKIRAFAASHQPFREEGPAGRESSAYFAAPS